MAEAAALVVKDAEFRKLENPDVGTVFEINDHRGVIVGIAEVATSGLFGVPTLYRTYQRAIQYLPTARYTISYILVEPKSPGDTARIQRAVSRIGYRALTRDEWRCRRQAVMVRICRAALRRTQRLMTVVSRETCAQSSRMAAGPVQDVALGQRLRPDSS